MLHVKATTVYFIYYVLKDLSSSWKNKEDYFTVEAINALHSAFGKGWKTISAWIQLLIAIM